jgi:phosphoribosylaminoimidazolecarboxamide formyltransferase/IMP cyclohydrolase
MVKFEYGENPSKGFSLVILMMFKSSWKRISYNLLDVDAAVNLINEFKMMAYFAIFLKHNNAVDCNKNNNT